MPSDLSRTDPNHEVKPVKEEGNLLIEAVALLVQRQRDTESWVAEQIWQAEERATATDRRYAELNERLEGIEMHLSRLVHEIDPARAEASPSLDERLARLREQVEELKSGADGLPVRSPSLAALLAEQDLPIGVSAGRAAAAARSAFGSERLEQRLAEQSSLSDRSAARRPLAEDVADERSSARPAAHADGFGPRTDCPPDDVSGDANSVRPPVPVAVPERRETHPAEQASASERSSGRPSDHASASRRDNEDSPEHVSASERSSGRPSDHASVTHQDDEGSPPHVSAPEWTSDRHTGSISESRGERTLDRVSAAERTVEPDQASAPGRRDERPDLVSAPARQDERLDQVSAPTRRDERPPSTGAVRVAARRGSFWNLFGETARERVGLVLMSVGAVAVVYAILSQIRVSF